MTKQELKELITPEFLSTLHSAVECCGWDENDGWEYSGNFDAFVKFARALYDEGYTKGFKVGHDAGWELNEEVSRRGL